MIDKLQPTFAAFYKAAVVCCTHAPQQCSAAHGYLITHIPGASLYAGSFAGHPLPARRLSATRRHGNPISRVTGIARPIKIKEHEYCKQLHVLCSFKVFLYNKFF